MKVQEQISGYINSQPERKRGDMQELHRLILRVKPACKLWFLHGKNSESVGILSGRLRRLLQLATLVGTSQ